MILKSSETAQKLKEEIEEESDLEIQQESNKEIQDKKELSEQKINSFIKKRPTFKSIGFKILLGKKAVNQKDEFSKMIIKDLEKNLMNEYFEIDEKIFKSRFIQLFSKYVH